MADNSNPIPDVMKNKYKTGKKNNKFINCSLIPDIIIINRVGINEINDIIKEEQILAIGKKYFGTYIFLIKFACECIESNAKLVESEKNW